MRASPILPILVSWILCLILGAVMFHRYCGHTSTNIEANVVETEQVAKTSVGSEVAKIFELNKIESNQPIPQELSNEITVQLDRLKADPSAKLLIQGFYASNETNEGIFQNLGIARANNLKQLFVQQGIDASRIGIHGKASTIEDVEEFGFLFEKTAVIDRASALEYRKLFEHNPIVLKVPNKKDLGKLSKDQRTDFLDLINFLDLDSRVKLIVAGHTDNVGEGDQLMMRSNQTAAQVKNTLVRNGISPQRISVEAYGSTRPLGSNANEEGRARNNRVEISIDK